MKAGSQVSGCFLHFYCLLVSRFFHASISPTSDQCSLLAVGRCENAETARMICAILYFAGALFTENERDGATELAFKYAVYRINKDRALLPNATIVYDIQYIPKDDSFHAAKRGELIALVPVAALLISANRSKGALRRRSSRAAEERVFRQCGCELVVRVVTDEVAGKGDGQRWWPKVVCWHLKRVTFHEEVSCQVRL